MSWKRGSEVTIEWNSTAIHNADDYSICYHKDKNQIVINLPPTEETATDTSRRVVKRKTDLSTSELSLLLNIVKAVFHIEGVRE